MESNFDKSLVKVLEHEGGYVFHPEDPGGETNLGVTKRVYDNWTAENDLVVKDMQDITVDDVMPIYKKNYWDKVRGDDLPAGLDWAAFDWAVNSGAGRPAKAIQRCVGATQDGAIGPKTLAAIANKEPDKIIEYVHDIRQKFYERLKTFKTFGRGWTRRNAETLKAALAMSQGEP